MDLDFSLYDEQGFLLTPPGWSPDILDALEYEARVIYKHELASETYADDQSRELNRRRTFVHDLRWKSELFARFLRSAPYRDVCLQLIGRDVDTHYDGAIVKCARDGHEIDWHQNEGLNVFKVTRHLTCFTAISPMTIDNGCLWIIPGSQRLGLLPHVHSAVSGFKEINYDKTDAIPVEMRRGEILVIHPLLLHMSGENKSDDIRIGYVPVLQETQPVFLHGERIKVSPVFRDGRPVYESALSDAEVRLET
jgi:phytanoyl-CoA hydroxylase